MVSKTELKDLVERVARAIRCGQRFTTEAAARAAIAVVVEEAAKVAEKSHSALSATSIADAIRALNPKEPA